MLGYFGVREIFGERDPGELLERRAGEDPQEEAAELERSLRRKRLGGGGVLRELEEKKTEMFREREERSFFLE